MISNTSTKLVTIASKGTISELGGISGPIINPCKLDVVTIVSLINGHKRVYEVNPANKSERVLLTLKNVKTKNFPDVVNPVVTPNLAPADKKTVNTATVTKDTQKTSSKPNEKNVKNDFTKK